MAQQFPLLSAIMLAGRNHPKDVVQAIECFKNQTYPNKELIIVNNAASQYEAAKLNIVAEDNIYLIDTPSNLNAGMARNYGVRASNGQILAQFDVDYWHAPDRLSTQIATMAENESHVCMLAKTLKYSFVTGNCGINTNPKDVILGTMVFVRPKQVDYPDADKNEEFVLLDKLIRANYSPITISNAELCCKLTLSDNRNLKPSYNNLDDKHMKIIDTIIANY